MKSCVWAWVQLPERGKGEEEVMHFSINWAFQINVAIPI